MVPLFMELSQTTVLEICARLHPVFQTMGLEITSEGEAPDALYIVRFGVVSVSVEGELVMEAGAGDLFGENEILGLTIEGRRNRTCIAKTSCELCRLNAEGFYFLLRSCPDLQRRCRLLVDAHLRYLEDRLMLKETLSLRDRTCVDWRQWAGLLDTTEASEAQANAAKSGNPSLKGNFFRESLKKIAGVEAAPQAGDNGESDQDTSHKSLKTWFQLHVTAVLPEDDTIQQVQYTPGFDTFHFAVLGLQYPGTSDIPGSQERVFSEIFPVQQDRKGRVHVDRYISIQVRHKENIWEELPGVRVVLYAVFYPASFLPPTGYLATLDDLIFSTLDVHGFSADRSFEGDAIGNLTASSNVQSAEERERVEGEVSQKIGEDVTVSRRAQSFDGEHRAGTTRHTHTMRVHAHTLTMRMRVIQPKYDSAQAYTCFLIQCVRLRALCVNRYIGTCGRADELKNPCREPR